MGLLSSLTGSISDSSGLGISTTGSIMIGLTDWAISDSNAVIDYDLSVSSLSYSVTSSSITRSQSGFVWYREKTCPTYYYELNSTTCEACHYSCLACSSTTNTTCSSCESSSFRSLSGGTCLCDTNYRDVGVRICQQIICPNYCTACSSDNFCTGCKESMHRTLDNGSCICGSYTIDLSSINLDNCQACYPTC